jgi:transporter family-2 protein
VALAGITGLAIAVQARVNGELAVRIGDGIAAAVISFATGLALLAVVVPLPVTRRGLRAVRGALRARTLRWWHLLGGVCGALVVAGQGLTVAALGVAGFTVALVAGQSASSLLVDRRGLGPGGAEPVTRVRLIGALLCVAAVGVAVADRLGSPRTLGLAVLPLLAGAGVAWQQAVNGRVRVAGGSVGPATLVNFVAGMLALLAGLAVVVAVRGWPAGHLPTQPWLYAGGVLGVLVIATSAAVVRVTGVLLLLLSATAGQVLGAIGLDLVTPVGQLPGVNTYAGAVLTLAAVAMVVLPRRAAGAPGPTPTPGRPAGSAGVGGVAGEDLGGRVDGHGGVVDRGGRLPEPGGDQPDLARIFGDVASGEDPRQVGGHGGVDHDVPPVQL